jgi:hypothetical protein
MKHFSMVKRYNEAAATHNYIFGFAYKKTVYAVTCMHMTAEALEAVTCMDYDSRSRTASLRFNPKNELKAALLAMGAQVVCDEATFEATVKASKYNRGEIFEKLVTEAAGQEWAKDNVPFTEDGDLTVDGIKYQIKYTKATFANEKSLAGLGA